MRRGRPHGQPFGENMSEDKSAAKAVAKDKNAAATGEKAAGKKKNPKRMVIIIAVAVMLLGGGGAAAFFLLRPAPAATEDAAKDKGADKAKGEKGAKAKDKKGESKKPFFVDFDMFTVNLKDPEKFLQIKLTFQVHSSETAESLKDLMPVLRSAVIPVLGGQDPTELMTPEGKEKLSSQVVEAANKALAGGELADSIDTVLITHMIIQ
jgi:flagellar FliL protein